MEKILFATDFSENAEKAFPFALRIAQKHDADLLMLHVFDIPTAWNYPGFADAHAMERQAIKESENKLKELFERHTEDISVKYITAENASVVKGIISAIEENDPGLVVIGTKGGSRAHEIIVGSTTKALLKQSPTPILAIPENAPYRGFKNVLYATDFQEDDILAIQCLIGLVQPFDAEITILHVSTHNEYKGDEKMEWFKDLIRNSISYDAIQYQLLLSDNIYERMNSYINEHGFDLLVMLEKGRNGIADKLFHHDLVEKMEFHTSMPLLSFKEDCLHAIGAKGDHTENQIK